MLTQELRGNLEALKSIPGAKGDHGSNLTSITRENSLAKLGVEKMGKGAECTFGKGQRSTLFMFSGEVTKVGGSNEVQSKLKPRSTPVELTREGRPRKLSPVPLDSLQHLKALP